MNEREELVQRMKIVLAHRDGLNKSKIARKLGTSRNTVAKWIARFEEEGVEGLFSRKSPGRPRKIPNVVRQEIVRLARDTRPPIDLGDQWTVRLLAEVFGCSEGSIAAIWKEAGFDPPQHPQQVRRNPDRLVPLRVDLRIPAWLKLHVELICREQDTTLDELIGEALAGPEGLRELEEDKAWAISRRRWTDQNERLPREDPRKLTYRLGLKERINGAIH